MVVPTIATYTLIQPHVAKNLTKLIKKSTSTNQNYIIPTQETIATNQNYKVPIQVTTIANIIPIQIVTIVSIVPI
jgi:hypothetical protein